ncbi:MAG TPA: magnesium transporter MgtC [Planctomycetales bacterium]|nr:magnesium transporter MgtC [Planctomycetales bacterium]
MQDFLNDVFPNILDGQAFLRISIRLAASIILGGAIGWERQIEGKSAGVRTHMMVSLGAALFALTSLELNADTKELTKVIQGVAAGVGFLGAGAIIKVSSENEPKGLTTAAGIWLTAAIGLAVGVGLVWPAFIGVVMAWLVLGYFHVVERWWRRRRKLRQHGSGQSDTPVQHPPT